MASEIEDRIRQQSQIGSSGRTEDDEIFMDTEGEKNEEECTSRLRSKVWKHFKRIVVGGEAKAICHYCGKSLTVENGTSHMKRHVASSCSKKQLMDPRDREEIEISFQKKEKMTFDAGIARKRLVDAVILHEYPLSLVNHIGFRRFLNALQPEFKVPNRNTIKNDIFKVYNMEKKEVIKLLEKNDSRVAITMDMWTANNQKRGFMAITAHYIDNSWILQSRILRFVYVPCPHTSFVLCEVLFECMMDWNIDSKLSTITLDNCSTNNSMIRMLKDKLCMEKLMMGGHFLHLRCSAHILNLIVQEGLKVISGAIENIRDSVAYWTATPKRKKLLKIMLSNCMFLLQKC